MIATEELREELSRAGEFIVDGVANKILVLRRRFIQEELNLFR